MSAVLISLLGFTTASMAQHDAPPTNTPPPPAGEGRLTIVVSHPTKSSAIVGLEIALYALGTDGRPGFAQGLTGADGRFVFEGISTDPGIVYLAGVRHEEIPFGERVLFETGQKEATVELKLSDPTEKIAGVSIEELRIRIDWLGDQLLVREILRLRNAGEGIIRVSPDNPGGPIVQRTLGNAAAEFAPGASSIGEDLTLIEGQVSYWGPLYSGEQRVEYEYTLPVPDRSLGDGTGSVAEIPIRMREAIDRVVIVAGTAGISASGESLTESREVQSDSGQALSTWARGRLRAGEPFQFSLSFARNPSESQNY